MTAAQIALLKRLIQADRDFHTRQKQGNPLEQSWRGVEVSSINGVDPRTAQSLVDAGLAEMINLTGRGNSNIFLGKVNPYDLDN